MKIAMVVRNYHKSGGISRCAAEQAEFFARDNEVHVFAASWRDADGVPIVFHKVPMLSFKFLKDMGFNALNNIFEIASFALFSRFTVKTEGFDIVHSHGSYLGRFDVFTTHSCHAESMEVVKKERTGFLGKLKKTVLNPLHMLLLVVERYSLRHANKIIAVSGRVKDDIIRHYNVPESRIEVIINGVNLERFDPANRLIYRDVVRKKYGLKAEDKVIIFPAHEYERKGLRRIINALGVIHRKNLFVLVVGEDDKSPFIPLLKTHGLEKNFVFTGKVSGIEKYYAASDLFVFPTSYEPFGLVILEAMAAGLPVIASGLAGASELIKDETNGLIIKDHSDYRKIAKYIRYLLNDHKTAETLGSNARQTSARYPWDVIADKTFKLYEDVLLDKAYESNFGPAVASCLKMELNRHCREQYPVTLETEGSVTVDPGRVQYVEKSQYNTEAGDWNYTGN